MPAGHSLDELRTEAIACLSLPDIEVLREWECSRLIIPRVAGNYGLEIYARLETPFQVSVRRVLDDEEIVRLTTRIKSPDMATSPDGHFLYLRGTTPDYPMEVRSLTDAAPKPCLTEPAVVPDYETFGVDSRHLAYLPPMA